jgi:tetratricopeptide (TPR) repeat protein
MENHAAVEAGALSSVDPSAIPGSSTHPAVGNRAVAAWCLAELGEFTEAIALGQQAVRAAETLQHPYSLALALFHLGGAYLRSGDAPSAVVTLERSRQVCETWDFQFYVPWASARLGAAYLLAGRFTDSLSVLKRARRDRGAQQRSGRDLAVVRLARGCLSGHRSACRGRSAGLSRS